MQHSKLPGLTLQGSQLGWELFLRQHSFDPGFIMHILHEGWFLF
jgi:hypothetical protein